MEFQHVDDAIDLMEKVVLARAIVAPDVSL